MTDLRIEPRITATAEHRVASSHCCAARLFEAELDGERRYGCLTCLQPCRRILSEPEIVVLTNG